MSLVGRQDRWLLVGLVIALIVLIARPVQEVLDVAHDVEHVLGLSLVPAFVVLTVALILHWQAKSYEAKSAGRTAEARPRPSRTAAGEIERLAGYGHLLERALDVESIRDAAAQALPKLTESDEVWVLKREAQGWRALNGTTSERRANFEGVRRVADTLRRQIAGLQLVWQNALVAVTTSFGVTIALAAEVARAEAALDRASHQGANSVRLIGEPVVA